MEAALAVIGLLAVLSIIGAFLGAESAKALFNSSPMALFWFLLAALFLASFAYWAVRAVTALAGGARSYRQVLPSPGTLAMHAGALVVLGGAMWGSDPAHQLRAAMGFKKVPSGYMAIFEGEGESRLFDRDLQTELGELPFEVYLKDFRLEYYPAARWGLVLVTRVTADGRPMPEHERPIEWQVGQEVAVPLTPVRLKVLRYLDRARPTSDGGAAADAASETPAMEILLACDGRQRRLWLVPEEGALDARLPLAPFIRDLPPDKAWEDTGEGPDLYFFHPGGPIKDYKSDLEVRQGGRRLAAKTIEVNDPLHWGGYHFYQHSYDSRQGAYTILSVVSDSGLWAVWLGFFLLVAGTAWRFWAEPLWRRVKPE